MSDRLVLGLAIVPMVSGVLFASILQRGEPIATHAGVSTSPSIRARHAGRERRDDWPGVVAAAQAAELASEYGGRVARVFAETGARLEQGEPILQIEQRDAKASVGMASAEIAERRSDTERAEANLSAARTRLSRLEEGAKWLAAREVDAARAEVRVAEAELRAARARVSMGRARRTREQARAAKYTLQAPFAGTLVSVDVDVGDTVSPGRVLARVISGDRQIKFAVPREALLEGVPVQVRVGLEGDEATLPARVLTVRPEVDAAAQRIFATAALPADVATDSWIVGTHVRVSRASGALSERLVDVRPAAVSP